MFLKYCVFSLCSIVYETPPSLSYCMIAPAGFIDISNFFPFSPLSVVHKMLFLRALLSIRHGFPKTFPPQHLYILPYTFSLFHRLKPLTYDPVTEEWPFVLGYSCNLEIISGISFLCEYSVFLIDYTCNLLSLFNFLKYNMGPKTKMAFARAKFMLSLKTFLSNI